MSRARICQKMDTSALNLRDVAIFKAHTLEGLSLNETAQKVGCSRDTVKRTKKKEAYHRLAQEALERQQYGIDELVGDLIAKTKAKKELYIGSGVIEVDDNITQLKAIERIGDIYGVNAPTNLNVAAIAGSSDEELAGEIEEACREAGVDDTESQPRLGGETDNALEGTVLPI